MNTLARIVTITVLFAATAVVAAQNVMEIPAGKMKKGESLSIPLDTTLRRQSVEVRAAVTSNPAHGNAHWSATLCDADNLPICRATVSWGETGFDDAFSRRYLRLAIDTADATGKLHPTTHYDRYENVDLHRGPNSLVIDLSDSRSAFAIGSDLLVHACEISLRRIPAMIKVEANRTLRIEHASLKSYPHTRNRLDTSWTADSLRKYLATPGRHPLEGYWKFLDRDNDPRWALPGGFYDLAVVRSADSPDTFDILYLSGARTNAPLWKPLMLKGRMKATKFIDHYLLQWNDASLNDAGPECSADLQQSAILQLNFPLHRTKIRFSRSDAPAVMQTQAR